MRIYHYGQAFFLSFSSFVASKISEKVTGEFFELNTLLLWAIFSVADMLEGFILLTTLIAAVAKKLLKDSAISEGSLVLIPLMLREEQFSFLQLGLRMALDKICKFYEDFLSCFQFACESKFFWQLGRQCCIDCEMFYNLNN